MEKKKRIEYIDAMRGFVMVLIVMFHIVTYNYLGIYTFNWSTFAALFHLPLFFFISGFVMYKEKQTWSLESTKSFVIKKFKQLIIPTVVFLAIYAYLNDFSVNTVVESKLKMGYWFTYILFLYLIIYVFLSSIMDRMNLGKVKRDVCLIVFGLCMTLTESLAVNAIIDKYPFLQILSLPQWKYFIFLIMGIIVKKHLNKFTSLIDNSYVMAVIIICFVLSVVLFQDVSCGILGIKAKFVGYGTLGICIVYAFFRRHEAVFSQKTSIGRMFQYIGRRTLDIYLIHFFFLTKNMDFLGRFFTKFPNPTTELFITLLLASMVIMLSLLVSNILRLSPFLAQWLLGERGK